MNRGIFTVLGAIIVVGLAGLYLLQHGQALFNSPPPTDRIAFISTRGGQTDLWTMKGDGDDKRQVTSDIGMDISPAWSPDCREIVSASNREENRYEIYVTAWNGKYIKRLTTSSGTKDLPGWSPDGKEIVFLSSGTVHVLSRFKGDDVQIMPTVEQGATQFARPFAAVKWAPDRRSLAAVEDADTTRRALVREDFDNPDREPIPLVTAGSVELAWSKKDYRVAVAFVDREGANGIQVADPANMDFQDIFVTEGDTTGPGDLAWSPDGKHIAFEMWEIRNHVRDKCRGLYVISAKGGKPRLLAKGEAMDPTWSPDGKYVAYTLARKDGKRDIWRVGVDGKGAVNLTGGEGDNYQPEWSPMPKKR